MKSKDTQSRKYQVTINNPEKKGLSHAEIRKRLLSLSAVNYFCMSDEIGEKEKTYHTHVFVVFQNPKLFSTIRRKFPDAHIENAHGTCVQNRDYVFKTGKWKETEKGTTSVLGTQEEWGEVPDERQCPKPELKILQELILEGYSNAEIIRNYPEYMFDISHIDRCRLELKQEQYQNDWREVEVTYISGKTATGKTRSVMEKYGYANVFRVTDYKHPFDTYKGEEVILFEEFSSSITIQDMLNYTDGYPLKLPARYTDKVACFTRVYIISNIPLENQYLSIQAEAREVWEAFLRRINKVIIFTAPGKCQEYETEAYINRFRPVSNDTDIPFLKNGSKRKKRGTIA